MKANILSLLAIAGLLSFAGCASEDAADKQEPKGGNNDGLTGFVEDFGPATRTTAEYDGSGLNFFWTRDDRLWVNNGTLIQDAKNNINDLLVAGTVPGGVNRADKAMFWFSGKFTANSYPVRYTGKNGVSDKVTIKAKQTQTVPNDASHIGEDGDCGIADAQKQTDGSYHFTLDHKAAYATFLPYNTPGEIKGAKITKIKVSADEAIAGTYDFGDNGLNITSPSSTSDSIELILNDKFRLPQSANAAVNAATIVIAPGTYTNFTVEYTLNDPKTNVTGTVAKTYNSVTFTAGRNKKVSHDLQIAIYPGNKYYMWDAQQHYWAGYEWDGSNPTQPILNGKGNSTDAPQSTWAASAHTPRDFNDIPGYSDITGASPAVLPSYSAAGCPNVNEACWYVQYGDPYEDNTTLWATMGHLRVGGIWLKKKDNISGYSAAAAPDGINYTRTTLATSYQNAAITFGRPVATADYFYLPAMGSYHSGWLGAVGTECNYWLSTPYTDGSTFRALLLCYLAKTLYIAQGGRDSGYMVWTAQ